MNATTQTMHQHSPRSSAFKWIASGSVMEALVAVAIIALSIIGLSGVDPLLMAAIATIIAGAVILIEGGAMELTAGAGNASGDAQLAGLRSGLTAEVLGALAGIILGILALLNVSPMTLLSIAVLVFGATFLLSGLAPSERTWFAGPADGFVLLGLSVAVLGLLAVIGLSPATLVLVGLLVLGAASLLGGSVKSFRASQAAGALHG